MDSVPFYRVLSQDSDLEEVDIELLGNASYRRNLVRPGPVCHQLSCVLIDLHLLAGHEAQALDERSFHLNKSQIYSQDHTTSQVVVHSKVT